MSTVHLHYEPIPGTDAYRVFTDSGLVAVVHRQKHKAWLTDGADSAAYTTRHAAAAHALGRLLELTDGSPT